MSVNNPVFVSWEEHIICHERGSRVVHFLLKDASDQLILAVVGTERSIRHMLYVVIDEFIQAYGSSISMGSCKKWRARREVVDWLTSLVSKHRPSSNISNLQLDDSAQAVESLEVSMSRLDTELTYLRDQMVPRKLKVQNSDIRWSGAAWICSKQLKHYPSFYRNETTIAVHSFVLIMAKEDNHYLGYLEDLYEDKKGMKKVKVRWFHHNQELKGLMPELNPHPKEVFMTPHVQVISAECVDGPATVLTPNHYEQCMAVISESSSSGVHMCFRQFKNNKVKPFTLTKLRGYSNQAILSCFDYSPVSKYKVKSHTPNEEGKEIAFGEPEVGTKRNRSFKEHQRVETGYGVRKLAHENQMARCEPRYPKLRLKLSGKTMSSQAVASQPHCHMFLKVDEKIELLCQDGGLRGCWFRCKILRASTKKVKIQYDDVQDVDGPGNLEEWVPAFRLAAPDKLGMRCAGRRTIRPCLPENSTENTFEVGAAVDAWLSDGWWEGVVTKVDISRNGSLQVYLPGEDKFITVQRENVRTSKDWVDNKWVSIKAKPDIISFLAARTDPGTKQALCPTMAEVTVGSGCGLLECKPLTKSKLEAVEEDEHELLDIDESDDLPRVVSKKQRCINSCGGDGDNDNGNNTNHNDGDDVATNEDKLVAKEDFDRKELEM